MEICPAKFFDAPFFDAYSLYLITTRTQVAKVKVGNSTMTPLPALVENDRPHTHMQCIAYAVRTFIWL